MDHRELVNEQEIAQEKAATNSNIKSIPDINISYQTLASEAACGNFP